MPTKSGHVFLSHTSADDEFIKALRIKLELHGISIWVDSRNLRAGKKLEPEIEQAILDSSYVIAVISPRTINSPWVRKEIRFAEDKGHDVIPLLLPGIKPSALCMWFDEEPVGENIELDVGKLDEKLPHILAALGKRAPDHDLATAQEVANKPIAELLLALTEPTLTSDESGKEALSARAEIRYIPPDPSKEREVSSHAFRFIAPIGQIEQDEIRWYLEEYLHWPVGLFRERAKITEAQLPEWGKTLYTATLGQAVCDEPVSAWQQARGEAERRFSVQVDAHILETGKDAQADAHEAASRLQSLPWELLHNDTYLSDGANPVRIRRRLPNFKRQPPSSAELPIRILLLSPRPEEKGVGYIDHRASALPLIQAVENLGDLVELTVLSPPTLPVLEKELHRAREAKEPYHVLHFDGHGVYDRQFGLGALCFEHPQDDSLLEGRRSQLVYAKASQSSASTDQASTPSQSNLASLLKDFRIPLVFLEACQTAQAETDPNASVAASLLEEGVTSVVAMSHSVLVETARRFVTEFYQSLAQGQRVGAAMLAGQRTLMRDTYRLPIAGAGDFHLQDWFVPILYQEQHDSQLFKRIPSATAQKIQLEQRQTRIGRLPEPPPHTFIGRSRDLLKVERLLEQQPYAVIRGQGGAGKTTLVVELSGWLVKSRRFDRCAFVSVEEYTHDRAVTEVLLQQLVNANHNLAAEYAGDIDQAIQAIRRTLENDRTLIVVDNMESLLADEVNKHAVLDVLTKLPEAKLLFTTRESLPEPFHYKTREIELGALELSDAKTLVIQVMNQVGLSLRHHDTGNTPQEVNDLVNVVGCHARALVLLTRELAQRGVTATTTNMREIMQQLEKRYPGQRENSLFASVELSLRRLLPEVREQIAGLAVFHDGGYAFGHVLDVDSEQNKTIITNLIKVGLASPIGKYGYIRLDPALPTYLNLSLSKKQRETYQQRWQEVMKNLVNFLYWQIFENTELAFSLAKLELPNLMVYLEGQITLWESGALTDEVLLGELGRIEQLLDKLNEPQAMLKVVAWCESVAQNLKEGGEASFQYECLSIERLLNKGMTQKALQVTQILSKKCKQGGALEHIVTEFDLANLQWMHGRILHMVGAAAEALSFFEEAQERFEMLGEIGDSMALKAISGQGACLSSLGQLNAATAAYEESIQRAKKLKDLRSIAVARGNLASVHLEQKCYSDAIQNCEQSLELFQQLGEMSGVAICWHQMGGIYTAADAFEKAEHAYRQSTSINCQQGNKSSQAGNLGALANLYMAWNQTKRAVVFYQQALDIYLSLGDLKFEFFTRSNIASALIKLQQYDDARVELLQIIECNEVFDHAIFPWKNWSNLYHLEKACGNLTAASEAHQKAMEAYLSYRRDGGENHSIEGRLASDVAEAIQKGDMAEMGQVLDQLLEQRSLQDHKSFLQKLQAILAGERDLALAEDGCLSYGMAVELIVLLESLLGSQGKVD